MNTRSRRAEFWKVERWDDSGSLPASLRRRGEVPALMVSFWAVKPLAEQILGEMSRGSLALVVL